MRENKSKHREHSKSKIGQGCMDKTTTKGTLDGEFYLSHLAEEQEDAG